MHVAKNEQPKFRTRKGIIDINVLGVCDHNMNFVYMLCGWEKSAADARVLRDAVTRNDGLKVLRGKSHISLQTVMDSGPSSVNANGRGSKCEKTRRTWSVREEEALIEALKAATYKGLKCENDFRCGYLYFLENELNKVCLVSNIRAHPHINSKIHVWMKTHDSLISMLSQSGIGWNDTDKTIEASNEAWEDYVKSDGNARFMQNKSWPYFNDCCEIFGNDRTIGNSVELFSADVQDVLNNNVSPDVEFVFPNYFNSVEGAGESMSVSQCPFSNATASKKVSSKKRKNTNEIEDGIVNANNNLADITKSTVLDLVNN